MFFGVNKLVFLNTLVNTLLITYVIVTYFLDCKSGKCIQVIDPAKHLKLKGPVSWVGSLALDASESWLVREYLYLLFLPMFFISSIIIVSFW